MPDTRCLAPTHNFFYVVTSTKGRTPWITADVAERLHPYIGGIVRAERGVAYCIGGVEDHVHIYFRWRPDGSVSDLMHALKSRSSKWLHYSGIECSPRSAGRRDTAYSRLANPGRRP